MASECLPKAGLHLHRSRVPRHANRSYQKVSNAVLILAALPDLAGTYGGVRCRMSGHWMSAKKGCDLRSSAPLVVPSRSLGSLWSSFVMMSCSRTAIAGYKDIDGAWTWVWLSLPTTLCHNNMPHACRSMGTR